MFNNQRYITKGINSRIPVLLQSILWNLIDTMDISQKDYIQVFELTNCDNKQRITHKQETPVYKKTYLLNLADMSFFAGKEITNPLNAKIYVIDNVKYSTILLSEEY